MVIGGEKKQVICLDPFDGLEEQAGDDRLNADPCAVVWSLDDEALVFFVARILPLGHDLDAVADLEGFGPVAGDGLIHGGNGSLDLILPVEDFDVACGDSQAVDGVLIPSTFVGGGPGGPIIDALLSSYDDGGFQIGSLDGGDMDGATATGPLTEYGEGSSRSVHERR